MKNFLSKSLTSILLTGAAPALAATGIVNPTICMEKSKFASAKRGEIETFGKELQVKLETLHKEYKEVEEKLKNTEYVDSITPEAEKALENEKAAKAQKFGMAQSEFSQMMQQKQMEFYQALQESIGEASQQIAQEKKFDNIASKDLFFFFDEKLDVTDEVIAKMDELYESKQIEAKKAASELAKKTSLEEKESSQKTESEETE